MAAGSVEGPAAGYSLQDAAAVLGVSVNTLRKRIRSGQVSAERIQRPQGYVWQVHLDGLQPPDPPVGDPPIQEAPSRLQQPPQALMQAEAMAAYTRSLLEPLVAHVAELEGTVREQAETIGTLRAELVAERAKSSLAASTGPRSAEPTTATFSGRLRPLAPWLLGVLAISIVLVLLMVR
jgi:hypothetical protein